MGGNNIINAIWSKDPVTLDDNLINPINNISSQKITLNVEGKIFNSITDNNGKATFKFNTINFQVKNYQCVASFESSDDYFGSSKEFNLSITTKTVYKTTLSNIKKIKKVKKYQVYKPTTKKIKVNCRIAYHKVIAERYIDKNSFFNKEFNKKIKNITYSWEKASKKDIKSKYKWYKSKYRYVTKYRATKIIYKYVNGKFVSKSVNKNYKFTNTSKFKNKRTKDWSKYVLPSTDCQSDNKKIIKLSKKIIKSKAKKLKKPKSKLSDKQKANAILKWVQEKVKYSDYGNTRYGALKSLKLKKGNCADLSHVTVALLRAANIPAKYNAKSIGNKGHCWPVAYLGGKWLSGEPTYDKFFPKFGKSNWTNNNWVKPKAKPGTYINSYKFSKKMVQYGKNKRGVAIEEDHYINGKWFSFYVLEGNADTAVNKLNLNKIILTG